MLLISPIARSFDLIWPPCGIDPNCMKQLHFCCCTCFTGGILEQMPMERHLKAPCNFHTFWSFWNLRDENEHLDSIPYTASSGFSGQNFSCINNTVQQEQAERWNCEGWRLSDDLHDGVDAPGRRQERVQLMNRTRQSGESCCSSCRFNSAKDLNLSEHCLCITGRNEI